MIFLGAGASKPFGIPTLQEFSEYVKEKLRKLGHEKLLDRIEKSLMAFNMTVDFESLYSIIEGLIDPIESIRRAGPLTTFYVERKSKITRVLYEDRIPTN